jgi:hypothetical protein
MKDLHKAVTAVLVIVVALFVYHMVSAHQGQSLMPAGLGSK